MFYQWEENEVYEMFIADKKKSTRFIADKNATCEMKVL